MVGGRGSRRVGGGFRLGRRGGGGGRRSLWDLEGPCDRGRGWARWKGGMLVGG